MEKKIKMATEEEKNKDTYTYETDPRKLRDRLAKKSGIKVWSIFFELFLYKLGLRSRW